MAADDVELSILIAGLDRLGDPTSLLALVRQAAAALPARADVIAVDTAARDVGTALLDATARARTPYVMTVDPDIAGSLHTIADLWAHRGEAEIVIASRYAPGGRAHMPLRRRVGSRLLNAVFGRGLSLGVRDGSSALRLYRTDVVRSLEVRARGYDFLQEVLVRAYAAGWRVVEIPLPYRPNPVAGPAPQGRVVRDYLRTFWTLWKLRNSIAAADYDFRAHDSVIPLQRMWQRLRYRYVTELIAGQGPVLDVGCGSSHIIGALPHGSVALDVLANKLRFARRFGVPLVRGSGFALPFRDGQFDCVLCSQVIEHVPVTRPGIIDELCRVLAPGGRLVLGTPDYDRWEWIYTEKAYGFVAPGGYADEHISHYTRRGLLEEFARRGYTHEATRYVLRGELILALRKPG